MVLTKLTDDIKKSIIDYVSKDVFLSKSYYIEVIGEKLRTL